MRAGPRRILVNILITLIAIAVVLVITEVVIRTLNPRTRFAVSVNTWDRVVGTKHVPGAKGFVKSTEYDIDLIINSKGLRDREFSYSKPDRTRRILCLGDSFTFGYGVEAEETYPKVMERKLNAIPWQNQAWEVLNAGVGSTGTAQQLAYFVSEGYKYQPDFVLLGFFQENDFWDNVVCGLYSLEGDRLVKHDAPHTSGRALQRLTRWVPGYNTLFARSHLLNFVKWRIARYHHRGLGEKIREEKGDSSIEEEERELTRALLLALKDACDRIGCQLVLTAIPSLARDQTLRETTLDLIGFAESSGIAYADINKPLTRAAAEGASLVYKIDGHWTLEGHELVGRALGDFFTSEGTRGSESVETQTR